jgi:predicted transposase/invertase (TIGR01784 family)
MTVQSPHDRFFRESFGRPEIARNFLEEYLPPELRSALDLSLLELQDGSFVDEEMRASHTDLLYQTVLKEGQAAYVYFLFEHKSFPDPQVALQLLQYMLRIWQRQVRQETALAPIIPLVIYHGESRWRVSTEFADLFDAPEEVRAYLPNFSYHLRDFSHFSDQEIRGEIWLRVSLSVMRAVFNPHLRDELANLVALIFQLTRQRTGLEYIRTVLYYLTRATEKVSREDLQKALLQTGARGEKAMTTIAQEFIDEGFARGIEKGRHEATRKIARQLLALRHDLRTISQITGLTVTELQALQRTADDEQD